METHMRQLNSNLEHILDAQADPYKRLYDAVANHIHLHTRYKAEFFIIDTEIRSLEGENHTYIISLRDHYEELVQELLLDGMEKNIFRPYDVKVLSYAIIAMCTEVSTWFKPDGRLGVQQVIDIYSQMISQGILYGPASAQYEGGQ
jgi:tetracycline repressor-like protein